MDTSKKHIGILKSKMKKAGPKKVGPKKVGPKKVGPKKVATIVLGDSSKKGTLKPLRKQSKMPHVIVHSRREKTSGPQYNIMDALETDFEHIRVTERATKIHLCIFNINETGSHPFLQFYLYKYPKTHKDYMIFPYKRIDDTTNVLTFSDTFARSITSSIPLPKLTSIGYIQGDHDVYMFYDVGQVEHEANDMFRSNEWWWVLISEIVNYKHVTNFPIHRSVTALFLSNPPLLFLFDEPGNKIETPVVAYHGTYFQLSSLIKSYGLKASTINAMMGPYYYFGTFRKAVRYAGWTSTYTPRYIEGQLVTDEDGRYIKTSSLEHGNPGGILRFALFLGKMKAFLNHPYEKEDLSDRHKEQMKEGVNRTWKNQTSKLHDYSGSWAAHYDSVYIGRSRLDGGSVFMSNPEFVVKQFEQQVLLSSHYLDMTTLQSNWKPTYTDYQIV